AGLDDDTYRVRIKKSTHIGISDYALFARQPLQGPLIGTGEDHTIIQGQNRVILGFFDKHMKSKNNGFPAQQIAEFNGEVVEYDNSRLSTWWNALPAEKQAEYELRIQAVKRGYSGYYAHSSKLFGAQASLASTE
ncbi:MAG: hypothetical protein COA36_11400, partial [Desulfotalea sp.]